MFAKSNVLFKIISRVVRLANITTTHIVLFNIVKKERLIVSDKKCDCVFICTLYIRTIMTTTLVRRGWATNSYLKLYRVRSYCAQQFHGSQQKPSYAVRIVATNTIHRRFRVVTTYLYRTVVCARAPRVRGTSTSGSHLDKYFVQASSV